MAGVKISELDPTFDLNATDVIPLARLGVGNGTTHKLYGSVLAKSADITTLTTEKVAKAGDTMSSFLTLHADPTQAMHAATRQYTDTKVAKAGDEMSGFLKLHANPDEAMHAATKQYVDAAVSVSSGTTNLGNTPSANDILITSSTGDDTTLPAATTSTAGVMTAADRILLNQYSVGTICRAAARVPAAVYSNNTSTDLANLTNNVKYLESTSFDFLTTDSSIKAFRVDLINHPFKSGHMFYARWTQGTGKGDGLFMVFTTTANDFTCYELEASLATGPTNPTSFKMAYLPTYGNSLNVSSVFTSAFAKNVYGTGDLGYQGHEFIGQYYINFNNPIPLGYTVSVTCHGHAYVAVVEPVTLIIPPNEESVSELDFKRIDSISSPYDTVYTSSTLSQVLYNADPNYNIAMYKISPSSTPQELMQGQVAYIPKNSSTPQIIDTHSSPMTCKVRIYDRASNSPVLGNNDSTPDYGRGFSISVFG